MQGTGDAAMPMESLLALVETLRARIDSHHADALRRSEMLTRYALIDPLLRELGWDTSDPDLVIPEYSSGSGRADYALLSNGTPVMMVEAKKLDELLQGAVTQGIQYCLEWGTRYFAVTDGRRWEIYETHRPVPINDKRIAAFDLKGSSAAEVCLQALALWRFSVAEGQVRPGQTPVIELMNEQPITTGPHPIASPPVQPAPVISQPTHPATGNHEWQPISTLKPKKGAKLSPQSEILFPDGSHKPILFWKSMLVEVTRWLINADILRTNHCPVRYSERSNRRYVVHTNPVHADGKPFSEPEREQIGSFYIDTKHAASQMVVPTRSIIEHVGQDPAQFKVRFS